MAAEEALARTPKHSSVRWKNIDIGPGYYYITGTLTEWLPLLMRSDVREIVCGEIQYALTECRGSVAAFVLMPDHLHLLTYLPAEGLLHQCCKHWRGRSARRVGLLLKEQHEQGLLRILARHANGHSRYAVWKEQPRSLPITSNRKCDQKIDYIHHNPVVRGLAPTAVDWPFSSARYYELGETVAFDLVPVVRY